MHFTLQVLAPPQSTPPLHADAAAQMTSHGTPLGQVTPAPDVPVITHVSPRHAAPGPVQTAAHLSVGAASMPGVAASAGVMMPPSLAPELDVRPLLPPLPLLPLLPALEEDAPPDASPAAPGPSGPIS